MDLAIFKKAFKRKDVAEEILKDLEESQRKYERLRKDYEKELEEWKKLSSEERKRVKSIVDLRYRFLEDDLKSFRMRVLHFLLTFVLGFAMVNLYFMGYYAKYGVLTEGMILIEFFFSLLFILTFLYYFVREKRLVEGIYKYFVLSREMEEFLKKEKYYEERST
ncbi:hypothetical protein [Persephonella sp. KM09-Lau-8]|uniref:hypothetical protein n=1 Tax=Persephonella sp. KM09-Lau-8 TaxID=1158345 RepID=UPI00049525BD|nr:hypothetical protein [Persephonella sp. KM09-Lau-8]